MIRNAMPRMTTFGAVLLVSALARAAAADPIIYQSATLNPAACCSGHSTFTRQFIGARFFVSEPTQTTQIGGHFLNTFDVFGAVVRLSGATDFPDSADLSTPDVVAATRIFRWGPPFEYGATKVSEPLMAHLSRGWYALVFGSGLFGTTFSSWGGALTTQHQRLGSPRFFRSAGLDPGSAYQDFSYPSALTAFVFVEGASSVPAVPEPGTMLLLSGGLAYLACRRRLRG